MINSIKLKFFKQNKILLKNKFKFIKNILNIITKFLKLIEHKKIKLIWSYIKNINMVFLDIAPGPEIDNELILFRELLKIKRSKYYNSLLISQGGRITQHLVEFLVRYNRNINHNIYNSDFKDFLEECEFIPEPIREFILLINEYRKNVVYSFKYEKELELIRLSFLETFNEVLKWFDHYCFFNYRVRPIRIIQIKKTIKVLNEYIELEKQRNTEQNYREINIYEDIGHISLNTMEILEGLLDIPEMLNRIKRIEDRVMDTNNTVNNIENKVIDTNETVHDIDNKVDKLLVQFKNLNDSINDTQREYEKKLEHNLSEEKIEKIMAEFTNICVKKIRDSIEKDIINSDEYKREENNLIVSLGKSAWNKLEDRSKTFLITSKITYENLNKLDDVIDYSGVCLLVTKALERELTKRFYKNFIDFLKEKYGKNYKEFHTSLLLQNPANGDYYIKKRKKWSLGGIPYILGYKKNKDPKLHERNILRLIDYSKQELFIGLSDNEIEETLYEYGSNVYEITKKYRNRAAHVDEIKKVNAEECFDYVLDVKQVLKKMLDSFEK